MKECPTCTQELPFSDYYIHASRKDGYSYECKKCVKYRTAIRRLEKPEVVKLEIKKALAKKPEYYKEKELEKSVKRRVSGAQKITSAKFRKVHPDRCAATQAKRRARKFQATPLWVSNEKISLIYKEAQLMTQYTGVLHVVDHIVPLKGRKVSGLHIETNLRVITDMDNKRKSNIYIYG